MYWVSVSFPGAPTKKSSPSPEDLLMLHQLLVGNKPYFYIHCTTTHLTESRIEDEEDREKTEASPHFREGIL